MNEKKKPGRFTIQFSMDDPQQQTVAELLEQQGRRKAQFLTSAVLRYIQEPQHNSGMSAGVSEAALEQMMLSILKKYPQFADAGQEADPLAEAAPPSGPWAGADNDAAFRAITNTLAAFQKG